MIRYFKLYTKSKTTKEKSEQMLADLEIERDYLENVLYSVERAECLKELEEIKGELGITPHPSPLPQGERGFFHNLFHDLMG
jgi:predicted ribosome quality control (RQC) complex YloA/Tae2 family protein